MVWRKSKSQEGSKACVHLNHFSHVRLFSTPWTAACQAPLPMEFSRQECWSGLPLPPPGDLPHPGTEPTSLEAPALQTYSLPLSHQENPDSKGSCHYIGLIWQTLAGVLEWKSLTESRQMRKQSQRNLAVK